MITERQQTLIGTKGPQRDFMHQYSGEEIKESLLSTHERNRPVEDLIATAEAAFEFIRRLEMKRSTKNAFYQLEKQFEFYKNLIQH